MSFDAPTVEQLISIMLEHRKGIVRQVAGVPRHAALALAQARGGVGLTQEQLEPSTQANWVKAYLRQMAEKSTLVERLYQATSWGREDEQARSEKHKQAKALEQMRRQLEDTRDLMLGQVVSFAPQDQERLELVDRKILNNMRQKGYFDVVPTIAQHGHYGLDAYPWALPIHGNKGKIFMVSDRFGDFPSQLPETREEQVILAEQWEKGDTPTDEEHIRQIYRRWFVLFHETAHCQYGVPKAPFQPTYGTVSPSIINLINDYCVGALACSDENCQNLLNENHSDVYATMLVLEASGHDPLAYEAVEHFLRERIADQATTDKELIKAHEKGKLRGFPDHHCTQWAMARVLDNVSHWKGKDPQTLRQLAITYASDGLVDFLAREDDPRLGQIIRHRFFPEGANTKTLNKTLMWLVSCYCQNGDVQGWFEQQDKNHPVYPIIKQSWDKLRPQLRTILAKEMEHAPWVGATIADGMKHLITESFQQVSELMERMNLPTNDVNSRAFIALNRQAQHAGEMMAHERSFRTVSQIQAWDTPGHRPAPKISTGI